VVFFGAADFFDWFFGLIGWVVCNESGKTPAERWSRVARFLKVKIDFKRLQE
jgi:hypothetical protein